MIQIAPLSLNFTDVFGNTVNQTYKANAGDIITAEFDIVENVYFETTNNRYISVNSAFQTNRKLFFPDYESMNGFYVGQNVSLKRTGTPPAVATVNTTITDIDYVELSMIVASIGSIPTPSGLQFNSNTILEVYSTDLRKELYLNLNLTQGNLPTKYNSIASATYNGYLSLVNPYRQSAIDGTIVRYYADLSGVIVGGTATLTQLGAKSGHILADIEVERLANVNTYTRKWRFTVKNVQIGARRRIV